MEQLEVAWADLAIFHQRVELNHLVPVFGAKSTIGVRLRVLRVWTSVRISNIDARDVPDLPRTRPRTRSQPRTRAPSPGNSASSGLRRRRLVPAITARHRKQGRPVHRNSSGCSG